MNILDVILGRKEKTGEKEWDAIEKSLINAESIEKSRKGKRRANHKYIRVFTKADGKDEYLYKKDMLSPFKSLLRFFGIGEEKIAKTYEKENIERSYGVDKKTYGMHVLEYLTNRKKWDGLFSKKDERKKHKKPVAQEVIEKRAAERKAKLNGTTEAPAEQADKKEDNKDKIPTINRSLMRKVYSLYNPIPEDKTEPEIKADVKPASEKVKEYIGRKMTKKPDGTTVMTWEDGRIIHTDRKGNVIYDNAETSQPKAEKDLSPAENATVAPTESAVENTSNTGARLVNVPVQIKERKVYIRGRMSKVTGYTELYINGNKVSFFKDYESGWNDMSEDDRNIINSLPNVSGMNFKETETVYKDLKGTKEEIIKQIENIGYDNSKLEKDFINCINNIEDEKEPEGANAEQKVKYAKLTKDGASLSIYKDGRIFLNNFMTAGGNMIWIQKDPHYKPEYGKYTDDWDLKTYGIIPFSSKNMFEELEKLIPDIQRMTYDEIVAYIRNDTKSLSEAMQGNQNARKPFTVDDFTVDTKNLIAETKANDDYISRMLSLQNSYKGYTDQMLANEIKLKSIGSTLTDKERRLGAKMALEMLIAEMRARNAEKKEQSPAETTETAAEEHQDRSEAMMGNDNAKKYGLPDEEYAYLVKLVWDNLKAGSPKSVNEILNGTEEFNKLSDEQKKQFSKDVLYVKVTDDITASNDRYLQKKALERQNYFDTLPEKKVSNVTFNSKNDVNDFIRNNIAEDIDLSNVKESDVKAIEPILNQIADRLKRLGLPKFNGIKFSVRNKDVVMAVDGTTGELSINLNRVKNPKKLWEAEQKYKEKHLAEMQRFHPKENYTLENVTRWSAFADENDVIRSTVDHEIGHYLLNSKSGSFSDVIRKLNDTRNGYDNFGNATIGMYHTASLDSLETIAELFAMYMGKERKLLPKEIIDTVESITGVQPMFEESDFAPVESSQEEHENRSKAMLGNDNAKKDVSSDTVIMNPRTYDNEEDQKKYNDALKYHIDFVNHSNTDKGYLEDTIKEYESYPDFENKPEIDALKDIYKEYIGEDYDETHKDLSEAMEGNQNAAGEHDVESVAKSTARLPKIAIKLGKDGNPVFLFRKSAWTE